MSLYPAAPPGLYPEETGRLNARNVLRESIVKTLALNVVLSILYFVVGYLTFTVFVEYGGITGVVFFPEGISLAFTILFGPWVAPGAFIGQILLSWSQGSTIAAGAAIGIFNVGTAILGGQLFHRWKLSRFFDHPRDVGLFIGLVFFILQPVRVTGGLLAKYMAGTLSPDILLPSWGHLWISSSTGQLLFAPLLIAWLTPPSPHKNQEFFDPILLMLAVAIVFLFAFGDIPAQPHLLITIFYPIVMWSGLRFGLRAATVANVLLVLPVTWAAFYGKVFMPDLSAPDRLAFITYFLAVISIFSMLMFALFEERRSLVRRLTAESERANRATEAAREANAAKTRFLGQASHDLRQPVQALILFIMELGAKKEKPITENLLKNFRSVSDALDGMLNGLLDLTRTDGSFQKPVISDFPLAPIFERIQNELSGLAEAKGLKLRVIPTTRWACSDPGMLERMLHNLVNNALRFTQQGSVVVACRRHGDSLRLEVRDSGAGIPQDEQHKIFREFFQLDNPGRDVRRGLGLGLSIVRNLADTLKHPLHLRSQPGQGSVFSVELPAGHKAQVTPEPEAAEKSLPDLLRRKRIAVMDDDPLIRDGLQNTLESWGCDAITGETALEIIDKCNGSPPAAIIADYRLEGTRRGPGEINNLRVHYGLDIPAGLITGETDQTTLDEILASGFPLLNKPIAGFKLRGLLTSLLTE